MVTSTDRETLNAFGVSSDIAWTIQVAGDALDSMFTSSIHFHIIIVLVSQGPYKYDGVLSGLCLRRAAVQPPAHFEDYSVYEY